MFVRILRVKLKPDGARNFARTVDDVYVPIVKKSTGFVGQVSMVSHDSKEAVGIRLLDCNERTETYKKERAAAVLKALEKYVAENQICEPMR